MNRKFWIRQLLIVGLVMGLVLGASSPREPRLSTDRGPETWQAPYSWPAPRPIPFTPDVASRLERMGWQNEASMRNTLPELLWLTRNAPPAWRPLFCIRLAGVCAEIDEDHAAYQALRMLDEEMRRLPSTTRLEGGLASRESLLMQAKLLEARLLARNGYREAYERIMEGLTFQTGYEHLLAAETRALMGDPSRVTPWLIRALTHPDGHPDRRWGGLMIPMRGLVLAHGLGLDSLVLGWQKQNGLESNTTERWLQERSTRAIIQKTVEVARKGPWSWKAMRDGLYQGACRGFDDTIRVSVNVNRGRVIDIQIASTFESRPFSSLTVIPRRIIRHQSLVVDAVTGATVTSCAILLAVEEALRKALR